MSRTDGIVTDDWLRPPSDQPALVHSYFSMEGFVVAIAGMTQNRLATESVTLVDWSSQFDALAENYGRVEQRSKTASLSSD